MHVSYMSRTKTNNRTTHRYVQCGTALLQMQNKKVYAFSIYTTAKLDVYVSCFNAYGVARLKEQSTDHVNHGEGEDVKLQLYIFVVKYSKFL